MILHSPNGDDERGAIFDRVEPPRGTIVGDSHLSLFDRKAPRVDGANDDGVIEKAVDEELLRQPQNMDRTVAKRRIDPRHGDRGPARGSRLERNETAVMFLDDVENTLGARGDVAQRADVR